MIAENAHKSDQMNSVEGVNGSKILVELVCKICLERQLNVVALPCGHLFSCGVCSVDLSKCPMCSVRISKAVTVYLS